MNKENTWIIAAIVAVIALALSLAFGIPEFFRYQDRADASNGVAINTTVIAQQGQLIEVEKQKAQIRIEEARGIAEAQRIISASLSPLYLQHEAIKAQERMAGSPNHTQIYIPVGSNGIPIVKTMD